MLKVSIITASFNCASTIKQTIESVLAQDYPNIEFWVIDGGSTDGTVEILKTYRGRIHYISEPDKGIYDAINKGLTRSTGDIVGILGSGDLYHHTGVICKVVDNFRRSNTQAVYGDLQFFEQNTKKVVRIWKAGAYQIKNWLYGWMPPHLTLFVKKSVVEQVGIYVLNLSTSADYEWMLRAFYFHQISLQYIPEVLVDMMNGGVSNSSLSNRWKANRQDKIAWLMNGVTPRFYTLLLKPLRKISQLFVK